MSSEVRGNVNLDNEKGTPNMGNKGFDKNNDAIDRLCGRYNRSNSIDRVVPVWEWILITILMSIPGVNIFMVIYWAISSDTNSNKRNFAIAQLAIIGAITVFMFTVFIVGMCLMGMLANVMDMMDMMLFMYTH